MPPGILSLETVEVGSPGNPADDTGFGAVPYSFQIGKYEVTTAQYVEFLNAKAKSDPDGGLWNNDMDTTRSGAGLRCDIRRSGEKGFYVHTVVPERANRPVGTVSFWDACRFCNWLHNGQGDGDTEDGAYTMRGFGGTDGRGFRRNPGARWFIPSEDEWYKAAYYDPKKPGGAGYWDYPTRSNSRPGRERASANAANYYQGSYIDPQLYFTEAGAFRNSPGPHGTFDQAGNVYEWTEGLVPPFLRCLWGGSLVSEDAGQNQRAPNLDISSKSDVDYVGFRVAGVIPAAAPIPVTVLERSDRNPPLEVRTESFPRRPWRDPENKKPFFPRAWFTWRSDEADLDQMAKEHVNLVLFVEAHTDLDDDAQLSSNLEKMRGYLDHAHRRGIKVLPQVGGWYGAHIRKDSVELRRQQAWVEAFCKHPALMGYQLYDEPEYRAGGGLGVEARLRREEFVEGLRRTRESIRQWDPNPDHLLQVVFNLVPLSSWTAYLPVVDSFQVDRYPCDAGQAYFGHRGEWGPMMMAWSMAHGVSAMRDHPHLRNPSPCMQGVGPNHIENGQVGIWRNPLYEETRYMAYSSLTVGSWGIFHWIRNASNPEILRNVARLYAELEQLQAAFEGSYEKPPFQVRHNHEGITRGFLTDTVPDITTLAVEDAENHYVIASNNTGTFDDVVLRLKLPPLAGGAKLRPASVLNEDWGREIAYDEAAGEWCTPKHPMCFGDINVWVVPKGPR